MRPALDLFSIFLSNMSSFAELTQYNKYVNEDDIMLYLICFNETERWREKKCEKIFKMWSTAGAVNIRLSQWAYVVCMLFIIMRYTLIRCLAHYFFFFKKFFAVLFVYSLRFVLICFTCSRRILVTDNNHSNATTLAEFLVFMHWKRLCAKCQVPRVPWVLNIEWKIQ